jgi:hypothetical protein
MDDDEDKAPATSPVIEVPAQGLQAVARNSSISHNRGRSENDNSLTGRFSRAAERLRSASKSRNGARSPMDVPQQSPYESIPGMWSPTRSMSSSVPPMPNTGNGTVERHPREVRAAMEMEGGMI